VVRPLVRRIISDDRPALGRPAAMASIAAGPGAAEAQSPEVIASQTAKMIDIAQVQGQVHAQSIQKVGELAQKNPHETVSIIREWLHDTPG